MCGRYADTKRQLEQTIGGRRPLLSTYVVYTNNTSRIMIWLATEKQMSSGKIS
jgi:hypothetical protein